MNVGVLTFQFAHNYGAMLQAFSLCEYLNGLGVRAQIINYRPEYMTRQYSISPLSAKSIKSAVKMTIDYPHVFKQYRLFENFASNSLHLTPIVRTHDELCYLLNDFDLIIVGSDQVWNYELTGGNSDYYLDFASLRTDAISYAASFGKDNLSGIPSNCIESLEKFKAISLREDTCAEELCQLVGTTPMRAVDPVFLHDKNYWISQGRSVSVQRPYCVYYSLESNQHLLECVERKSEGLPVYAIHPTCQRQPVGTNLHGVGPREFLDLVSGAEIVFTNSFHGLAFSAIFGRDVYTAFHSTLGSRTLSLLRLFYVDPGESRGLVHVDFSNASWGRMNATISQSECFIEHWIKGI